MFTRIKTLRALKRLFPNSLFDLVDEDGTLNVLYDDSDEMDMYAFDKKRIYDICNFYLREDFILRKAEEGEIKFSVRDLFRCTRFTFKEKIKILEMVYFPKRVQKLLLKDEGGDEDE